MKRFLAHRRLPSMMMAMCRGSVGEALFKSGSGAGKNVD